MSNLDQKTENAANKIETAANLVWVQQGLFVICFLTENRRTPLYDTLFETI